jgi:hypothetical protein
MTSNREMCEGERILLDFCDILSETVERLCDGSLEEDAARNILVGWRNARLTWIPL